MQTILRALVGLLGLLFLGLAAYFLLDPTGAASSLGIGAMATLGHATLRGDFFAFFGTAGGLAMLGAISNDARHLMAPLLLMALALAGRLITIGLNGFDLSMVLPMVVEAIAIALFVLGGRTFAQGMSLGLADLTASQRSSAPSASSFRDITNVRAHPRGVGEGPGIPNRRRPS